MSWGSLLRRYCAVQIRQHVGSLQWVMPTSSCLSARGKVDGVFVAVFPSLLVTDMILQIYCLSWLCCYSGFHVTGSRRSYDVREVELTPLEQRKLTFDSHALVRELESNGTVVLKSL